MDVNRNDIVFSFVFLFCFYAVLESVNSKSLLLCGISVSLISYRCLQSIINNMDCY